MLFFILFQETLTQWKLVFYLAAAINVFGNFFYIAFASAKEQPWSKWQPLRHS